MSSHNNPILPVLGRVPSGVFILTASDGEGRETGMLASWVQQASFEPQQVTVAVNGTRYLNQWLNDGAVVGLSLVAVCWGTLAKASNPTRMHLPASTRKWSAALGC